jgi:two-component system sensor histidine kinase UhpB
MKRLEVLYVAVIVWLSVLTVGLAVGFTAGRTFANPVQAVTPQPPATPSKVPRQLARPDKHHAWLKEQESCQVKRQDRLRTTLATLSDDLQQCAEAAGANQAVQGLLDTALDKIHLLEHAIREELSPLGSFTPMNWGLRNGLAALVEHVEVVSPIPLAVHLDPSVQGYVTANQANHVLGIVREALANAIQHSQASQLSLRADLSDRRFMISVCDDGVGFDPEQRLGALQRGLADMQARTEAVKGMLQVETARGAGTIVTLTIPLPR